MCSLYLKCINTTSHNNTPHSLSKSRPKVDRESKNFPENPGSLIPFVLIKANLSICMLSDLTAQKKEAVREETAEIISLHIN